MRHTKLDHHTKFHPKKLAVRGTYLHKKVEFLCVFFLPKEEVSGFLAIRDMGHTKLDLHAKFHPKKLAARGTYAPKSRTFCAFFFW